MPAGTEEERAVRERARTEALHAGTEVQLELLARLGECAELAEAMAERGLASALGDATTAVFLAGAAARSAGWAVRSNLREIADQAAVERTLSHASGLVARVEAVEGRVRALLERRLA
jgi:formiminotetrahydrofolate cyclodeaminase